VTIEKIFKEVIGPIDDHFRPNGVCVINKCLIRRLPYALDTRIYSQHQFFHFFVFLLYLIQTMPSWLVDLEKYFESYSE
jgi:hypothetical protein